MVRPNADMKPVYIVTLPRDIETERVRITRKQKKNRYAVERLRESSPVGG